MLATAGVPPLGAWCLQSLTKILRHVDLAMEKASHVKPILKNTLDFRQQIGEMTRLGYIR